MSLQMGVVNNFRDTEKSVEKGICEILKKSMIFNRILSRNILEEFLAISKVTLTL